VGHVVALGRPEVDFLRPQTVRDAVKQVRPTVIWNAVADTAVDDVEAREAEARQVNAETPGILAEEAQRLGVMLVHFSTDYVFDGRKAGAYVETDATNPLNAYGRTKLAGETAVARAGGTYLILRTSRVYGPRGHNFLQKMLELSHANQEIRVVSDQVSVPTWSRTLAEAASAIATRLLEQPDARPVWTGTYHLAAKGATSWYGFACAIRDAFVACGGAWRARIMPIAGRDYHSPAERPMNSVLSSARAERTFGLRLPQWDTAVTQAVREIYESRAT
jgi:dTDP-4-dehydrorhamnose reductase